jgi:hypothetical protein
MLERTPAPQVIPTTPIRPVVRREQEHRDEQDSQREPQRRNPPAAPPATPSDGVPHIDEYAQARTQA